MTKGLIHRLFRMFTGALLGYMWGWMWGWSLFDPNSDVWALAAGLVAIVGLVCGAISSGGWQDVLLLSGSMGLYLSWLARTFFFGDIPGGWGVLLMVGGIVLSGVIGLRLSRQENPAILLGLVGALYIGFFGGFVVDVLVLDKVLGWVHTHSILSQAPAVVVCGVMGGGVVARWSAKGGVSRSEVKDR